PKFQSWTGMAHGGMVALMLDEAVGWAAWHAGHPGVTGRLQVSFRRPLKLGERVRVVGQVERVRRTLVYTNAYVQSLDDGGRCAASRPDVPGAARGRPLPTSQTPAACNCDRLVGVTCDCIWGGMNVKRIVRPLSWLAVATAATVLIAACGGSSGGGNQSVT